MLKYMTLWLLATVYISSLQAQQSSCSWSVQGRVLEAGSGMPLADVTVYFPALNKGTHTNDKGEFSIPNLCNGTFILVTKHLNHDEKKETITIQNRNVVGKIMYVNCHVDTLHQATIKGSRIHWEDVNVSHKLQGDDLTLTSGNSLGKTLEKVNGVYNLSTGNHISKPVIRGMHSNRVLIMNNELRQEGQQWGNEHAPEIDPFMAKEIEVVKGAQSIRYGSDVIGGLILVNPAPMKSITELGGEVNLTGFSNGRAAALSATLQGNVPKHKSLSWRVQGTFRRAGNSNTPDYFLKNTGMKELNYSATIGYQRKGLQAELFHSSFHTDIGIFAGSHIGNLTDLYAAFERDRPIDSAQFSYTIGFPFQQVAHSLTKAKLNLDVKKIGQLQFIYGLQQNTRKEFDKTLQTKQDDGSYKPALHFQLQTQNLDISFKHNAVKRIEGSIGVNGFYQTNNYYGSYFIPNYQKVTGGLYWIEKWHKNAFSLEGGLRYDVNQFTIQKWENKTLLEQAHQYHGVAATLSARYQFPFITLHANGGTAWRAPFVNEMYSDGVHHSAATYEIGDRNLVPERNYNASLTVDFNYKKKIQVEWTLFSNYINNYINLQPSFPATLTIRGAFPTYRYSQVDAWFYGTEFASTWSIHKRVQWHHRANITLAKDVSHDAFIVGIPPMRLESDLDLSLLNHDIDKLTLNVGGSYTFRQGRIADSMDYVPAPNGYFLFQSNVVYQTHLAQKPILIHIGVDNLFNTRYRDYMNRNRYFAQELGRNIYLRLNYKF
jgi:iron complex outermembrane receptor protein